MFRGHYIFYARIDLLEFCPLKLQACLEGHVFSGVWVYLKHFVQFEIILECAKTEPWTLLLWNLIVRKKCGCYCSGDDKLIKHVITEHLVVESL